MRRSEGFLIFTLITSAAIFGATQTLPTLYFGLIYGMVLFTFRGNIREKPLRLDAYTIAGILLIGVSPMFLIYRWGDNPSPSTFQAVLFLGVSLVLFDAKTILVPSAVPVLEVFLAAVLRLREGVELLNLLSGAFVDITSHLVRGLVDVFNVPIIVRGNVAVVRSSMVIIGSGCSGLDAFILYLLAAGLLILLRKSDGREASLLLLGALGIIPLNAVRIFTLLVIGYHSGISFLELFHSHIGDMMFVAYVFGYWWWVLKRPKNAEKAKNG
ncbi:hypothetical protein GQS_06045 [Thermococcus sp. 4557]|uniref:archaeosortase/exosortase family protein n=1 Tax=Thermococcus sp. (strain CGMCC 1.5172 / 4557) TaxID=1042877 RepID=UPI000219EEF2|nr:archaeosortase/exosortase family protein [Thermococcus sp. 4557]AEK73107.1 hypothetical protein GQS_06045 [Thermococcus sp. 4557]